MLIIGEKLNSSIPKTLEALKNHDEIYIINLIKLQASCGADFLDINTALTGENEIDNMLWVIGLAIENSECGIMLDSPNPDVILQCISKIKNRNIIINSITLEEKYDKLINAIKEYNVSVVCLPIKEKVIPQTPNERLANAKELVRKLQAVGIPNKKIYIDVLVEATATGENAAITTLNTIKLIKENLDGVNTICGLSNVSFGLPNRAKLNSVFLSMTMLNGLDSAIIDITSEQIKDTLFTSRALLGKDEYCLDYIDNSRNLIK